MKTFNAIVKFLQCGPCLKQWRKWLKPIPLRESQPEPEFIILAIQAVDPFHHVYSIEHHIAHYPNGTTESRGYYYTGGYFDPDLNGYLTMDSMYGNPFAILPGYVLYPAGTFNVHSYRECKSCGATSLVNMPCRYCDTFLIAEKVLP